MKWIECQFIAYYYINYYTNNNWIIYFLLFCEKPSKDAKWWVRRSITSFSSISHLLEVAFHHGKLHSANSPEQVSVTVLIYPYVSTGKSISRRRARFGKEFEVLSDLCILVYFLDSTPELRWLGNPYWGVLSANTESSVYYYSTESFVTLCTCTAGYWYCIVQPAFSWKA